MVYSGTSNIFTLGSGMKGFLKNGRGLENGLKWSKWETWVILMTVITSWTYRYLVWSWTIDGKKSRMKVDLILDISRLRALWVVLLRESSEKLFFDLPKKNWSSRSYRKPPKWWLFLCTHEIRFWYQNANSQECRLHETEGWFYWTTTEHLLWEKWKDCKENAKSTTLQSA